MTQPMPAPGTKGAKPRLMFYCQHALGLGHLVRSTEIVRGLNGFDVTFVNAGEVIEGFRLPQAVELVNLPPLKLDEESQSIRGNGEAQASAVRAARKDILRSVWQRTQPEILMIELFPFGRKKFEFELIPLLRDVLWTRASTKVVCSLRDILVARDDQARWEERVSRLANTYFDLILVHSDPRFQRLEETFGRVRDIRCEIRYTGFVAQARRRSGQDGREGLRLPDDGKPLIVTSIGGGRIGAELLYCAIQSSGLIREILPHHLLVVAGPHFPEAEWSRLQQLAGGKPEVKVLRYTARLSDCFDKADLSISLAGYNTCMDILTTRVPALVYPIAGYNKDEQRMRAQKLESLGAVSVIRPEELTPEKLSREIVACLERKKPDTAVTLDMRGVENTARILSELVHRDAEPVTLQLGG